MVQVTGWKTGGFDADASRSNGPLHSALLMELAAAQIDNLSSRTQSAGFVCHPSTRQRLFGWSAGDDKRFMWLRCFYVRTGDRTLKATLYGNSVDANTTHWITILRQNGSDGLQDETTLTSRGEQSVELTLDVSQYDDELITIAIVSKSEEAGSGSLTIANADIPSTGQSNVWIKTTASPVGYDASKVYALKWDVSSNPDDVPDDALLLERRTSGADFYWLPWPCYAENVRFLNRAFSGLTSPTPEAEKKDLTLAPLGYFELYTAELRITDASSSGLALTSYRSGREPSARAMRALGSATARMYDTYAPVELVGPSPDMGQTDPDDATRPLCPSTLFVDYPRSAPAWVAVARWDSGDYMEKIDRAGSSTYQETTIARGLIQFARPLTSIFRAEAPRACSLRLVKNDQLESGSDVATPTGLEGEVEAAGLQIRQNQGEANFGYLVYYVGALDLLDASNTLRAHHARGLLPYWPGTSLDAMSLSTWSATVTDTARADVRSCRLEIKTSTSQRAGSNSYTWIPAFVAFVAPSPILRR